MIPFSAMIPFCRSPLFRIRLTPISPLGDVQLNPRNVTEFNRALAPGGCGCFVVQFRKRKFLVDYIQAMSDDEALKCSTGQQV
jgi:hypothetical protein